MALCDDWKEYFEHVLRYKRRVGDAPPLPPAEPIPEGCDLSPCDGPSIPMANAIEAFRNAMNAYYAAVANPPTPPCVLVAEYRYVNLFGQNTLAFALETDGPPGFGCGSGTIYPLGDDPLCSVPDPPPDPPIPPEEIYSSPLLVSVTGGPLDGSVFSSSTNFAPTALFYESAIQDINCVCQKLSDLIGVLFQVGSVQNAMLQVQQKSSITAQNQQQNHIETLRAFAEGLGMLGEIIQNTGADLSGKSPKLVNSRQTPVRASVDVQIPTFSRAAFIPAGTCNTYTVTGPTCAGNPYPEV